MRRHFTHSYTPNIKCLVQKSGTHLQANEGAQGKRVLGFITWSQFHHTQAGEGGYYRLYSTQWARRRPSVAGRSVLGVRAEGFCGCGAARSLLGLIYRRRRDMCRGYSQSSLVGAKTATLLLPAHLESRLSGSAERLCSLPSSLPTSIHPSLCLSCRVSLSLPPPTTIHYLSSCRGSIEI